MTVRLSRRRLLELGVSSGAALAFDVFWPSPSMLVSASSAEPATTFAPSAWLAIDSTSTVTITVAKTEMGQGVWTALPMLVAEELDADWSRVRVRQADAEPGNTYQITGGSGSVSESWDPLRRAGAVARHMLVDAAARRWNVAAAECTTAAGVVKHLASGRSIAYGDLVADASTLAVPDAKTIALKPRDTYTIIGRPLPRLDTPPKIRGEAIYGLDVRVPGLLHAVVLRCPTFGGSLKRADATGAKAIPGVRHIVELAPIGPPTHLRGGVAVVADTTWAALEGRRALHVEWESGPHASLETASIRAAFHKAATTASTPIVARNHGDVDNELARRSVVEATYEYPFLAHATMEPQNGTARVEADRAEIWAPTQHPVRAQRAAARLLGLAPEHVTLHVTFAGGAFGRRLNEDFVIEAVRLSKAIGGAPVQVLWTRDDDLRHDFYRQAGVQQLRAAVDDRGMPIAIVHRVIGPSTHAFYTPGHAHPEEQELWGLELPYAIAHHRVEYVQVDTPVPIGWWRGVSVTQNQFCIEAFVSELARRAGRDPIDYRRALLAHQPRAIAVLDALVELSEWRTPVPSGRARGMAITSGGRVAEVVECSLTASGAVKVDRVSCVIDCGQVVNPGIVEAQAEGSIVWGLTAALMNEVTIAGGAPQPQHFVDYPVMRMSDMPELRIRVLESRAKPEGVGEPPVIPVAPALAAAVSELRGAPVRSLPIRAAPRP